MQQVPQSSSQRGRRPRPFSCRTMSILTCRVSRGPDSTRSAEGEDNHSTRQVPQSSSQCCRHSRPLSSRTLSTLTGMATQFVEWCLPMPGAAGQQSSTCCGPSLRLGLGHPRIPGNGPHRRCDRATPGSARNLEGRRSGVHPRAGSPGEARGAGSESLSPLVSQCASLERAAGRDPLQRSSPSISSYRLHSRTELSALARLQTSVQQVLGQERRIDRRHLPGHSRSPQPPAPLCDVAPARTPVLQRRTGP